MADTRVSAGLTVEQWDDKFFTEYLTENRYAGEMGTNENSIIQVKENLSKKPGDRINFALVNKLTQDAITGRDVLEGNEEDMSSRSFELPSTSAATRFASPRSTSSSPRSASATRPSSYAQGMVAEGHREADRAGACSINGVALASTEAQRDAWLTDNTDRVYFASGYAGTDHSAAGISWTRPTTS
jgi:hypothetical protein